MTAGRLGRSIVGSPPGLSFGLKVRGTPIRAAVGVLRSADPKMEKRTQLVGRASCT